MEVKKNSGESLLSEEVLKLQPCYYRFAPVSILHDLWQSLFYNRKKSSFRRRNKQTFNVQQCSRSKPFFLFFDSAKIELRFLFKTRVFTPKSTTQLRNPFVSRLLLCCNDVETNPGPLANTLANDDNSSTGSNKSNKNRTSQGTKDRTGAVAERTVATNSKYERSLIREDRQKLLEGKHDILVRRLEMLGEQMDLQKNHITELTDKSKTFETLIKRIDHLEVLLNEKDGLVQENQKLRVEAAETKELVNTYESRLNELQVELQGVRSQLSELLGVYDDLQDRLYEIDRSWQNNLVFYGIKPDAGGVYESLECLEHKVKGVLRNQLNIGRDIPITRCQRIYNGSDVRGFKPVVVNFAKWSDKEDILRKSKILKNSGIHVEEDFSRAAKFRRKELEKLAKEVKNLSPEKKCIFKYDKLIIDDNVYIFNDIEKRIERLPYSVTTASGMSLEDEVGDASHLGRRIRNRNAIIGGASPTGTMAVAAKRAQSVESVLERIPQVDTGPTPLPVSPGVALPISSSIHGLSSVSKSVNGRSGSPGHKGRRNRRSPSRNGLSKPEADSSRQSVEIE